MEKLRVLRNAPETFIMPFAVSPTDYFYSYIQKKQSLNYCYRPLVVAFFEEFIVFFLRGLISVPFQLEFFGVERIEYSRMMWLSGFFHLFVQ